MIISFKTRFYSNQKNLRKILYSLKDLMSFPINWIDSFLVCLVTIIFFFIGFLNKQMQILHDFINKRFFFQFAGKFDEYIKDIVFRGSKPHTI